MFSLQPRKIIFVRGIVILLFLVILEISVRTGIISPLFVPSPSMIFVSLLEDVTKGPLVISTLITLYELTWAFCLATIIGVALGYLFWRFHILGEAYDPMLAGLFASPIILLYPIFLVFFGRTIQAVIAQGVVLGAIPVILYTRRGFSGVEKVLIEVGKVMGLSKSRIFRHIILPSAAPTVFTGLRLGLTYMLISVVAMEYVAQLGGVGNLIAQAYFTFNIDEAYTGVVAVIILSIVFIFITDKSEKISRR